MSNRQPSLKTVLLTQLAVMSAFGVAFAVSSPRSRHLVVSQIASAATTAVAVPIPRKTPLSISPLYNRSEMVRDEELAAVLDRLVPRFDSRRTKPNWVEHALRIWGVDMQFDDPAAMSGAELKDFLTDHGQYAAAWGEKTKPLLQERHGGISIRWGREPGASVHHDHWLASLTEAGVSLNEPVYGPGRRDATIGDVLQEALRDFRLDERETEWTAMAFGLWLPPKREWVGNGNRLYSFDLIARRLMRGKLQLGVCSGTHRVYSLVVLLRLNQEHGILSPTTVNEITGHLIRIRDLIAASQWEDGRWPSNWPDGRSAAENPLDEDVYKQVIATGHHLEWLAVAPTEFHPPQEQIDRAARWIIDQTIMRTAAQIMPRYTFFSHVGNALALWRGTRPGTFYRQWQQTHPFLRTPETTVESPSDK